MVILIGVLLVQVSQKLMYFSLVVILFLYGLVRLIIVNHGYLLLTIIYPKSGRDKLKMTIIVKNMAYYIGATIISVELKFVDLKVSFAILAGVFLLLGIFSFLLVPVHEDLKVKKKQKNQNTLGYKEETEAIPNNGIQALQEAVQPEIGKNSPGFENPIQVIKPQETTGNPESIETHNQLGTPSENMVIQEPSNLMVSYPPMAFNEAVGQRQETSEIRGNLSNNTYNWPDSSLKEDDMGPNAPSPGALEENSRRGSIDLSERKMLTIPVIIILCTMLMNRISNNVIVMMGSLILNENLDIKAENLGFYYIFSVSLFFILFFIYMVSDLVAKFSNFSKIVITNYSCVLACLLCTPIFFENNNKMLLIEILTSLGILFFGVAGAQGFILVDMFEYHENFKGHLDALTREYYISTPFIFFFYFWLFFAD